jgi:hypothetical protein
MITDLDDKVLESAIQPITPTFSLPFFCYRCNLTKRAASLAAYRTPAVTVMICAPCARTLNHRKEKAEKKAKKRGRREKPEIVDTRVVVPELLDDEAALTAALSAAEDAGDDVADVSVVLPLVESISEKIVSVRNPKETAEHAASVAVLALRALGLPSLLSHGFSPSLSPPSVSSRLSASLRLTSTCRRLLPHLSLSHPAVCFFDQVKLVEERARDWQDWLGREREREREGEGEGETEGEREREREEVEPGLAVRRLRLLLDFDGGAYSEEISKQLEHFVPRERERERERKRLRAGEPEREGEGGSRLAEPETRDDLFALSLSLTRRHFFPREKFVFFTEKQRKRLAVVQKQVEFA